MSNYKSNNNDEDLQNTILDIHDRTATKKNDDAENANDTVDSLAKASKTLMSHDSEYRSSFEIFKSNVCHHVKDMGDIEFIIDTLEKNTIRYLYEKKWYPESLYLLGMVDYLSKLNDLPMCSNYNDIRNHKLVQIVYPLGILILSTVMNSENVKEEARKNAIPEFMRFNIVENDIRNLI